MYPILLQLGHFELRAYGVLVVLAAIAGIWLSTKEARRKALDPWFVQDFAVYAFAGGIVGARLYYVLFSNPSYFLQNPLEIAAFWRGGIGVIGFLLGGFLAGFWYCRRRGIPVLKFADTLAPGIALAQTLGQLACLANGDGVLSRRSGDIRLGRPRGARFQPAPDPRFNYRILPAETNGTTAQMNAGQIFEIDSTRATQVVISHARSFGRRIPATSLQRFSRSMIQILAVTFFTGLLAASATAQAALAGPIQGEVVALALDEAAGTIFVATADAVYRSGDQGRTWTPLALPPAMSGSSIKGLSLPGMPVGVPGMPGNKQDTLYVYYLSNEERPTVFASF